DLDRLVNAPAAAGTTAASPKATHAADLPGGLFDGIGEETIPDVASSYRRAVSENYQAITTEEQLQKLVSELREHVADGGAISVDTETDRLDPMQAKLCGISLSCHPHQGVYIPVDSCEPGEHLAREPVLNALRPVLEDANVKKVGQNLKYDMLVFRRAGVELAGIGATGFDTIVASYLLDATRSSHKLDNLALAHLQHEMIPITDLIGTGRKQKSMAELTVEQVTTYAAEDADVALRLRDVFEPQLQEVGLSDLFRTLEMPLVEVLAELEFNGIHVDPDELDRQKKTVDARIFEMRQQILDAAEADFNPDSPKQLADVLFKQLGCRILRRGKTGPSTDSGVLQRIADEQPPPGSTVAALVLEYRMLTKLRNTYLESLKQAIHPETKRIHASFNQTVTQTGRLSSSDPNLQNIPIRTELGKQIRRAFVAAPGHVLMAADYSQVELRMLAHLSQDESLLAAFDQDLD
ncbi:MAG: DNA polymerase, partial [Phycisphaeraceae bacterium]